jgi:hypothetical protein
MRIRYTFWSMAPSLVLLMVSTQAKLFAQYTISTLANSTASTGITAQGIAVDNWNNVYVTGTFNHSGWLDSGVINVAGGNLALAAGASYHNAPFPGCGQPWYNLGFSDLGGLAVDGSGSLYIAESGGDELLRVNGTATCLMNGQNGADGFNGVVVDNAGNVYFASNTYHKVYELAAGATIPTTLAGPGSGGCAGGQMGYPGGMARDNNGNLYLADRTCNVIWKVSGGNLVPFAGKPGDSGYASDGLPANQEKLNDPSGVAVDPDGNLYIADTGNFRVWKVNISSLVMSTIAGNGGQGYSGDGGSATSAEFYNPFSLAIGQDGTIYVGDAGLNPTAGQGNVRVLRPAVATMNSPTPGSVLISPTTFTWTTVTGADAYRLMVGSSPGTTQYFDNASIAPTQNSAKVNTIPCGGPVYVTLITKYGGDWLPAQSYTYKSQTNCAVLVTPPYIFGEVLPGTSVVFGWSGAPANSVYQFDVSDKVNPIGQGDVFTASNISATNVIVSGIPCDGRTIYVQLSTLGASGWQNPVLYTYKACKAVNNVRASPTTLPQQGGTVTVSGTVTNYNPTATTFKVQLQQLPWPVPPCYIDRYTDTYICPVPRIVSSETLYSVAPDSTQTFDLSVTVPAWYPSGRSFLFSAVAQGTSYVDSGSVVVFEQ